MHRPHRPGPGHGFTLIEMIVVISIIVSLMAIGIPALINSQNQADDFATPNVIESVHNTCQRYARQLGSAGAVYGFTLTYSSNITGKPSADAITPWVTDLSGTHYQTGGNALNLMTDFGKSPLWSGNDMKFWDRYRPCNKVVINGGAPVASLTAIHVAYEPRTGFPHVSSGSMPTLASITTVTTPPDSVQIQLWNTRGGAQSSVVIHKTGVCNAHNGP